MPQCASLFRIIGSVPHRPGTCELKQIWLELFMSRLARPGDKPDSLSGWRQFPAGHCKGSNEYYSR